MTKKNSKSGSRATKNGFLAMNKGNKNLNVKGFNSQKINRSFKSN